MSFQTHMQFVFQLHTKVAFQEDLGYNLSQSNFYVFVAEASQPMLYGKEKCLHFFKCPIFIKTFSFYFSLTWLTKITTTLNKIVCVCVCVCVYVCVCVCVNNKVIKTLLL